MKHAAISILAISTVLVPSAPAVGQPVDGLVAHYPFEGDALDASSNGHDGTEFGGVSYGKGVVGQAARFDGVDDYIIVPHDPQLEPTVMTVSVWVNSTVSAFYYIFSKYYAGDKGSYALYTRGHPSEPTYGTYFYTGNTLQAGDIVNLSPDGGAGVWDGQWHHLVGIHDGAMVHLYVDGNEIGTGSAIAAPLAYSGGDFQIATHAGGGLYGGLVDELRIYNRVLTDSEIQELFSTNEPPVALCEDLITGTELQLCTAAAEVDSGSFDPEGDAITLVQEPPGPYDLGDTEVSLTVEDSHGLTDTCTAIVTVVDEAAPVVECTISQSDDDCVSMSAAATDNCGAASISLTKRAGDHDCEEADWEASATDMSGNTLTLICPTIGSDDDEEDGDG